MNILEEIAAYAKERVESNKKIISAEQMKAAAYRAMEGAGGVQAASFPFEEA